jgi:hypothetical protein
LGQCNLNFAGVVMSDLIYIGIVAGFFILGGIYLKFCEKLMGD